MSDVIVLPCVMTSQQEALMYFRIPVIAQTTRALSLASRYTDAPQPHIRAQPYPHVSCIRMHTLHIRR